MVVCVAPDDTQALEEELNRRQSDIRQLTEAAGKLQERQVLEYQALIGTLTVRWQELQSQFQDFQKKEKSSADLVIMGGPDFVTRVNKLREAISSVSRQLHCPPLNLKHYEQLSGQEDSLKVKTKNSLEIVNWSVLPTRPVRLTTPACDPQFAPVSSAGSPFLIGS